MLFEQFFIKKGHLLKAEKFKFLDGPWVLYQTNILNTKISVTVRQNLTELFSKS